MCKASETGQPRKENEQLKAVLRQQHRPLRIVGESPQMQEIFRLIGRVGPTNKPILIQGESGTGKELVAKALHEASPLADKPLVVINCAALPETLLESELFGHEGGPSPGQWALSRDCSKSPTAARSSSMRSVNSASLQAKLLRVLEDGTLRRVGSVKERRVHVRLIAATNRDLQQDVNEKRFRETLYYRINVLTIQLPPLRRREGDLRLLVEHLTGTEWKLDPDVMPILERYSWPGNVRQLQNALDRAKILADNDVIEAENLPPEIVKTAHGRTVASDSDVDLDTLTREHVLETYRRHECNKAWTAACARYRAAHSDRLLEKYNISDSIPNDSCRERALQALAIGDRTTG